MNKTQEPPHNNKANLNKLTTTKKQQLQQQGQQDRNITRQKKRHLKRARMPTKPIKKKKKWYCVFVSAIS